MTREYHEGYQQGYKDAKEEGKEPTTKNNLGVDCISREAVNRIINKWLSHSDYELKDHIYSMTEKIHNLPSVTPIRPKGYWISRWHAGHDLHFHVCSECNEEFSCDMETGISIDNYRYCPNCGAKMVKPQESEDKECI